MRARLRLNWVVPIGIQKEIQPWLDERAAKHFSPKTIYLERTILFQLSAYLWTEHRIERLRDAKVSHLEAWQRARYAQKLSSSSLERFLTVPKSYYRWLEKRGDVFLDPARGFKMPKFRRPMQPVPSEMQMRTLLLGINADDAVSIRDRAFLEIAYATGFRSHELAAMNLDSLDLIHGTARIVGKGKKERVVPLTRAAIAASHRYLEKSRPLLLRGKDSEVALWIGANGDGRVTTWALALRLEHRQPKQGRRITLHGIRRAFATHLLRGGASVAEIKELLGHSSYRHIGHYLRTAPMELQAAHRKSRLSR